MRSMDLYANVYRVCVHFVTFPEYQFSVILVTPLKPPPLYFLNGLS